MFADFRLAYEHTLSIEKSHRSGPITPGEDRGFCSKMPRYAPGPVNYPLLVNTLYNIPWYMHIPL